MSEHDSFFDELEQAMNSDLANEGSAARPRPDLWQQIRADFDRQTKKEENTMSTVMHTPTYDQVVSSPIPGPRKSMGQYLNAAASIALVLAVAVGGWFATMNLNSPEGSDGTFGLLGQTDSEATCDVEPLSVDRVMEIVKNPNPYMENGPAGEPTVAETENNPTFAELYEPEWTLEVRGPNGEVGEEQFESVNDTVDSYLTCAVFGNVGQAMHFWSPYVIQRQVLAQFPVFADEETVRDWLESELDKPALSINDFWDRTLANYEVAAINTNPDRGLAIHENGNNYYFAEIVTVGVLVENADGDTVLLTTGTGNQLVSSGTNTHEIVVSVAQSPDSGQWYVIAHYPVG